LGLFRKQSCESLLKLLIDNFPSHSISICRTIVEEVRANLTPKEFHSFVKFINVFTTIDEDFLIPFEMGAKYEAKELKEADALIAAYAEWVGADALVTENRHFLSRHPDLPFKILTAEECLKLI
jgi:predicted nucleic acid-binding protein